MNGKLLLAVVQILVGIVLCCTALLKPAQPKSDPTQSVQPDAVPTSIPYAPVIAGSGLLAAGKGLWDLYKILFDEDEEDEIEAYSQQRVPSQYGEKPARQVLRRPAQYYERSAHQDYVRSETEGYAEQQSPQPYGVAASQREKTGFSYRVGQAVSSTVQPVDAYPDGDRQPVYEYEPALDFEPKPSASESVYLTETEDEPLPKEFFIPLRKILARAETSWVLCGAPGVGKTTFLLAWMADCISFNPGVQFFINGWKNDEWLGLARIPGVFKRNLRERTGKVNFDSFFEQVGRVADILHARLELPTKERDYLKNNKRIWLVFDDYFSTSDALNKAKGELAAKWETARAELGQIITLGREVGVALCAATHSLNIKALGLEDSNVRGCLSLCALCKVFVNELGRKEGGYEAISNALRNPYIIPPEYANNIASIFSQLRVLSESNNCAIALTTFGTPTLGLVEEDLSWVADYQVAVEKKKSADADRADSASVQTNPVQTNENFPALPSKLIPFVRERSFADSERSLADSERSPDIDQNFPEPWSDADPA